MIPNFQTGFALQIDIHEENIVMEGRGWRLSIPLEEMKSSFLGISFLLNRGGYFWCILLHTLQYCRDENWQPISGSNGLRVIDRSQKGGLCFCELKHGNERGTIPFTLLETTAPDRLMISKAVFTGTNVDQSVLLSLLQNAFRSRLLNIKICYFQYNKFISVMSRPETLGHQY